VAKSYINRLTAGGIQRTVITVDREQRSATQRPIQHFAEYRLTSRSLPSAA